MPEVVPPKGGEVRHAQSSLFGEGATIHHVGMVVRSIQTAAAAMGVPEIEIVHDPVQKVRVAFVDVQGQCVEFIEPAAPDSPVNNSLSKGIKLAHFCYSVPDIEKAIAHAKAKGLAMIAKPVPAVAFGDRKIAWLYSAHLGLFELVEALR
ncbi:MAG: VOC family protein [Phycisphaerales bacterium]